MANTQAMATTFMQELMTGTHNFGVSPIRAAATADTFYGALLLASGTFNASSTDYTGTVGSVTMSGEVSGTGYTAGGVAITNATAPSATNTSATAGTAYWTPSASITYTAVTLSTAFDAVMVYNFTQGSAGAYPAVSIHTFGSQTITAGTFTLTMPSNTTSTALIRLATT
tara:strand:+ start:90 stop:599 length:510 start_codon:yes stop_codon:yes gene_type:complete